MSTMNDINLSFNKKIMANYGYRLYIFKNISMWMVNGYLERTYKT